MEALDRRFTEQANETRAVPAAESGYLAQAEMRDLIAGALDLGWTLVAYEADLRREPSGSSPRSADRINWREEQQARNLATALQALSGGERLLVWCGNGHLFKLAIDGIELMGLRFREHSGVDPFAIDQTVSVDFGHGRAYGRPWVDAHAAEIEALGGSAGFLADEAPLGWYPNGADAFVVSVDNDLS